MTRAPAGSRAIRDRAREHDTRGAPGGRRLLLISYHFAPGRAIGALRWRRMIPLLAEKGWGVDVVTAAAPPGRVQPASAPGPRELPAGTAVVCVAPPVPFAERVERAIWRMYRAIPRAYRAISARAESRLPERGAGARDPEPSAPRAIATREVRWRLAAPRGWLRLFWTHLERRRARLWSRSAARAAARMAAERDYLALVVSSPPHWTQEAGRIAAARARLPYVADLRDPWSATAFLPEHVATPEWLRLAVADEGATLRAATLVLANTEPAAEALRRRHPRLADRVRVVRNGWDGGVPGAPERTRFTIAYAGSIYGDRTPEPLFRAVARARSTRELDPADFGVDLMGRIDGGGGWVGALAERLGIGDLVTVHAAAPRAEAERFMARAAMLVSLPWGQDLSVPAKVYDYLRFEAWPLILARPGSAPARTLSGTGATVVDPDDVDAIADVLCDRYDRWRRGERPGSVRGRERFSREAAVGDLLEHLQSLVLE